MGLAEFELLRLVLTGGSAIDWPRLRLGDQEAVERFLALCLFDLARTRDTNRLRVLLREAGRYLRRTCGIVVPRMLAEPDDLRTPFLLASQAAGTPREQRAACCLLKCALIAHHLEARELMQRMALREVDLSAAVDRRVRSVVASLRGPSGPVVELSGRPKSTMSLMTKLLVKDSTVATQVFDRLRYRIVTERREQIAPLVVFLSEQLFPFCNVIPGQTTNDLLDVTALAHQMLGSARPCCEARRLPTRPARPRSRLNPATADGFKTLKFVIELPIRADQFHAWRTGPDRGRHGFTLLPLVELQILDLTTAARNKHGPASHERYKQRQLDKVRQRLLGVRAPALEIP